MTWASRSLTDAGAVMPCAEGRCWAAVRLLSSLGMQTRVLCQRPCRVAGCALDVRWTCCNTCVSREIADHAIDLYFHDMLRTQM